MLSAADLDALAHARHRDPFAVLGMHPCLTAEGSAVTLTCVLPLAVAVDVLNAEDGTIVATATRLHAAGVFGATVRDHAPFAYRLRCTWPDGHVGVYADAFAFGPQLSDTDLHFLQEGSHLRPYEVLGAHPTRLADVAGTRFAVWAPNASRVSVVGSFNGWDGRRHPMRHRGGSGVWEIFIPHAGVGDTYKFEIADSRGQILPLKADPYAFASQLRPASASVIHGLPPRRPLPADRAVANHREAPISIYELHAGSWRRHPDGRFYSWDELAASLPLHAAGLGFTHVELMPTKPWGSMRQPRVAARPKDSAAL
jgi:1,4-alpha-glucan branching enzyme